MKTEISYLAAQALGIKLAGAIFVSKETFNKYHGAKYIKGKETVTSANTNILNFKFLKDNYPSLSKGASISLYVHTYEPIMDNVEVFKLNGVTDEYAVLRIRIFGNSGRYLHSRTQQEIEEAGNYYYDQFHLNHNPPQQKQAVIVGKSIPKNYFTDWDWNN